LERELGDLSANSVEQVGGCGVYGFNLVNEKQGWRITGCAAQTVEASIDSILADRNRPSGQIRLNLPALSDGLGR
jgi:hypothetical protein